MTGPATAQARIRITSVTDPTVKDVSNANATLGGGSLTVIAPAGGETWAIDSTHSIRWSSSGLTGNVKIEVSRNGGTSWTVITASTPPRRRAPVEGDGAGHRAGPYPRHQRHRPDGEGRE